MNGNVDRCRWRAPLPHSAARLVFSWRIATSSSPREQYSTVASCHSLTLLYSLGFGPQRSSTSSPTRSGKPRSASRASRCRVAHASVEGHTGR